MPQLLLYMFEGIIALFIAIVIHLFSLTIELFIRFFVRYQSHAPAPTVFDVLKLPLYEMWSKILAACIWPCIYHNQVVNQRFFVANALIIKTNFAICGRISNEIHTKLLFVSPVINMRLTGWTRLGFQFEWSLEKKNILSCDLIYLPAISIEVAIFCRLIVGYVPVLLSKLDIMCRHKLLCIWSLFIIIETRCATVAQPNRAQGLFLEKLSAWNGLVLEL